MSHKKTFSFGFLHISSSQCIIYDPSRATQIIMSESLSSSTIENNATFTRLWKENAHINEMNSKNFIIWANAMPRPQFINAILCWLLTFNDTLHWNSKFFYYHYIISCNESIIAYTTKGWNFVYGNKTTNDKRRLSEYCCIVFNIHSSAVVISLFFLSFWKQHLRKKNVWKW